MQEREQQQKPEIDEDGLERRHGGGRIHERAIDAVPHEQHAPKDRRQQREVTEGGVKDRNDPHVRVLLVVVVI